MRKKLSLVKLFDMPIHFYLEKRLNKYQEAPIRVSWTFNGERFLTTLGFCVPQDAWDASTHRVTPKSYNHKNTPTTTINGYIDALTRAANRMEHTSQTNRVPLTRALVRNIIADVMSAGGKYPEARESSWKNQLLSRSATRDRYFQHFKGGKYKLIGIGKESETLEDVVVYEAMFGIHEIWVRPYNIFFSKVTLPDGSEVDRFKEITML